MDIIEITSLGIDIKPRNIIVSVMDPPPRKAGSIVDSVDTLLNKLRNEAAVIS